MPAPKADFEKALQIGRPPNIVKLFPNSKALLVSGKIIDRALLAKGGAMTIAANGRSHLVIRGALAAAQRANAAIIIEIARSEGGAKAYCAVNYWNMARQVDALFYPGADLLVCKALGKRRRCFAERFQERLRRLAETLLDLHDLRLNEQADDFVRSLRGTS